MADRLPETDDDVIIARASGCVGFSRLIIDEETGDPEWDAHFTHDRITHWQPLPNPPKGESA